jgi:hypothetical protein
MQPHATVFKRLNEESTLQTLVDGIIARFINKDSGKLFLFSCKILQQFMKR